MSRTIVVRYGELALKSEPVRRRFERALAENIRLALGGLKHSLRRERGRFFVTAAAKTAIERLTKIPGITSVSPAVETGADLNGICSAIVELAKRTLKPGESFAIRASRVGEHDFSSRDVGRAAGEAILKALPNVRVNLSSPDKELFVEVRWGRAYVFSDIMRGVGGLPVGTQGKVIALLSDGSYGAAAAYLMMKRGCRVSLLHLDDGKRFKGLGKRFAVKLLRKLAGFHPKLELLVAPFGELSPKLERLPPELAELISRRAALMVAEIVAARAGAKAIVLGEDAERVANLTLANLRTVDEACKLPVLRPLVGFERSEIEEIIGRIGADLPPPPPAGFRMPAVDPAQVRRLEEEMNLSASVKSMAQRARS